ERAGPPGCRWFLRDVVRPPGQPSDHPGGRHLRRRRRGTHYRPRRRTQHQAPRPDDPRPDERKLIAVKRTAKSKPASHGAVFFAYFTVVTSSSPGLMNGEG